MSGPKGHILLAESAVVTTNVSLQEGNCEAPYLFDLCVPGQICLIHTMSRARISNKFVQQMWF